MDGVMCLPSVEHFDDLHMDDRISLLFQSFFGCWKVEPGGVYENSDEEMEEEEVKGPGTMKLQPRTGPFASIPTDGTDPPAHLLNHVIEYEEIVEPISYNDIRAYGHDLDLDMYKARIRITADLFLMEANDRGKEANKKVFAYMVGLGLGVWKIHPQQPKLFIDTFAAALRENSFPHISTLNFAYIDVSPECRNNIRRISKKQGIYVQFNRRQPAQKIGTDELLVATYAWDGNAFPGNEYWMGENMLDASGDPAAACCSTIAELHNPLVNDYTSRIKVHGV